MITYTKALQRIKRPFASFADCVKWSFGTSSHESAYFYTLHKCASTLFSGYVLRNVRGLRHIDYARQIYHGKNVTKVMFKETGHVYGPIRLSVERVSPVYKMLVKPASDSKFVTDKIAIFLVRDPRDILVSAYYSFGYTHGLSEVREIRERQSVNRKEIQTKTVDEYVLDAADTIVQDFDIVDSLSSACKRSTVLKYETMVDDYENFIEQFTKYIDINRKAVQHMFERSRPKRRVDTSSHRRSGKPENFRTALRKDTISALNEKLANTLERFQYQA